MEVFVVDSGGFSSVAEEGCERFVFACGWEAEFSDEVVGDSAAFSVEVVVFGVVDEVDDDGGAVVFGMEVDFAVFDFEFEGVVCFVEGVSVFDFGLVFGELVVDCFEFAFGSVHSLYMVLWGLNSVVCVLRVVVWKVFFGSFLSVGVVVDGRSTYGV